MRPAKGCARRNGKVEYLARFSPDVFQIVADLASRTGSSSIRR
jgi:hypothetical protein